MIGVMQSRIERALIVGLGSIGRRHLRLLRSSLPDADIRVLRHSGCDGDVEFADGCFETLADACAFSPAIAVIASPASEHLNHAYPLAEVGAHLLVEKPISVSQEGVKSLIKLCKDKGLRLQVGYNLRFLRILQSFRSCISNGLVGEVYSVRCEVGQYLPDWRPGVDYRQTVSAQAGLGGGVLRELSHELDLLRWIFGEVKNVSARIARQGSLEIDAEDSALLQLEFKNTLSAQIAMDFLRRDQTRACTAIGEKGTLRWDVTRGVVEHFDPAVNDWQDILRASPERDEAYRTQLETFLMGIGGLESDRESEISARGEDALAVMQIIDAARESEAKDGIRVEVPFD